LQGRDFFYNGRDAAQPRVVATYPYRNEVGRLLYEVARFKPKSFAMRRRDGRGGWVWNMNGARRVLYRLDELQGKESVFVVEGEKDADALTKLGLSATTSPWGAAGWRDE